MASAEVLAVYDHIRQVMKGAGGDGDPVGGLRTSFDNYAKVTDETMKIEGKVTNLTVEGVPCAWHTHDDSDEDRRLMYVHGGGYMAGGLYSHGALASRLSKATGCCVLMVDYRLTPEHAFPAPVEDATAAFKWMLENGPNGASKASKSFISGDSAGGGLTLATMMSLRDSGDALPTAAIPISAWTDLAHTGETMTTRAEIDPIAGGGAMDALVQAYLQGKAPQDTPLGSPMFGDFSGLPPILFHVGDAETLLDDSRRCHQKALDAGVKSEIEVWDDMPHVWHLFAPYLPQSTQAIKRIGEYVRSFS
ncbi:MAG: alpha/beta hydrolase [Pseudomonadales bacterium]|nr:alpha/beta hydrolase [Pseudomonadales bacterium]